MTMTVMAMGGVGILAVAFVTTSALRTAPASLRHLIWLAALGAILALPLLEWSGVDVEVPVPGALLTSAEGPRGPEVELGGSHAPAWASAAPRPPVGPDGANEVPASPSDPGAATAAGYEGGSRSGPVGTEAVVKDAASGPSPAARTGPGPSKTILSGIWLMGVLALLLGTVLRHVQARVLTLRDVEPAPSSARARLDRLAAELGIDRPVRLVVSSRLRVPATCGIVRSTVVLPADWRRWSRGTLDRVLLHELAHVQRRDCPAYLVGELARAVHWPNPLAWLALRRLRAESERASDDRVLSLAGAPSAYAQDLVSMARAVRRGAMLPSAALAMASRSGISSRVRAILDPTQRRGPVARPVVLTVGLVAVGLSCAATVLTPVASAAERSTTASDEGPNPEAPTPDVIESGASSGSPQATPARAGPRSGTLRPAGVVADVSLLPVARGQERLCIFRESGSRSTSMNVDDDEIHIRWETDDCRVEIDIEGDVEFSPDDADVVGMAPGALFEVEERAGRERRRARLEAGSGGVIERRYWDDGQEVTWGPEARRWLGQILPEIFRHSTINAEARVRRMLDEGGTERVFREVEQIRSDHVARTYLELMMELGQPTEGDYRRVIQMAGGIESDHGSATLLLSVIEQAGLRPSFQDPLLRASEAIESDHQRTQVLAALLDSELTPEQLDAVLRSASAIESDHNLSQLLSRIAEAGRLDDAGREAFLAALRSIESDHSQGVVIDAFLDAGPLSDDELTRVLTMTDGIESDHERGEILRRIADEYPLTGSQVTAYLRSASRLGSDHESARTAIAVIERADFDGEQMDLVLRMADDVGSDHNRGEILIELIERRDLTSEEVSNLLGVARGIGSDHRLAETLSALIEEQSLDADGVTGVLSTLTGVGSDHQRVTVMTALARRFDVEGRARALYEELAADLGSRDRERVLGALAR